MQHKQARKFLRLATRSPDHHCPRNTTKKLLPTKQSRCNLIDTSASPHPGTRLRLTNTLLNDKLGGISHVISSQVVSAMRPWCCVVVVVVVLLALCVHPPEETNWQWPNTWDDSRRRRHHPAPVTDTGAQKITAPPAAVQLPPHCNE